MADILPEGCRLFSVPAAHLAPVPERRSGLLLVGPGAALGARSAGPQVLLEASRLRHHCMAATLDTPVITGTQARARIATMGADVSRMSDEDTQKLVAESERRFREEAPMTAAAAATVILNGVKADRWRILVGDDAQRIDDLVRQAPERAYEVDFFESFAADVGWRIR